MIKGIGLDVIELERIESLYKRKKSFADRILTGEEKEVFHMLDGKRQIEFLAGRFAGKEALAKAFGCGIGEQFSFQDASILADERGKPHVRLHQGIEGTVHISITHTQTIAAAQVIWEV
ncbi:holo-ACP synthase [Alteribacter aurantiacus]|uniref:holo-ACP synthase n=1 Tax=Alteribacter aurantiacus TaxID=254410 RepID=UPI00040A870D|nr:holo-ACP synthase [Alteribacter aurantiacus]